MEVRGGERWTLQRHKTISPGGQAAMEVEKLGRQNRGIKRRQMDQDRRTGISGGNREIGCRSNQRGVGAGLGSTGEGRNGLK
jgi:hypothetical protein